MHGPTERLEVDHVVQSSLQSNMTEEEHSYYGVDKRYQCQERSYVEKGG